MLGARGGVGVTGSERVSAVAVEEVVSVVALDGGEGGVYGTGGGRGFVVMDESFGGVSS